MNDYGPDYSALNASLNETLNQRIAETDPAAIAVISAGLFTFVFIFAIIAYVIVALLLGRIFQKAGQPQWPAWVPIYNSWKLLELGGQQGFWAVLAFIPFVNIVSAIFTYIAMYHIGKGFGKSDAFVLLAIFLPIVWYIWLAVDKSEWKATPTSITAPTA